tara:strand:+ start:310 stop:822 length:513 start_codon:yes stop_codon:yes gene_type:complete
MSENQAKNIAKKMFNVSNSFKSDTLNQILKLYKSNSLFRFTMDTKRVNNDLKKKILGSAFNSTMPEINLINYLIDSNLTSLYPEIVKHYNHFCDLKGDKINVSITTTSEENQEIEEKIKNLLNASSKNIALSSAQDKSLVGGIKVRIQNKIIDGSISTKLKNLKEKLMRA